MTDIKKPTLSFTAGDEKTSLDNLNTDLIQKAEADTGLINTIKTLTKSKERPIPRLAFSASPLTNDRYAGIFKPKRDLLPDSVIKQIRTQNLLVAAILNNRGNAIASFGKKRASRFDLGFKIDLKPEFKDVIEPEDMTVVQERISKMETLLMTCGSEQGVNKDEKMSLTEFLYVQGKNACSFGRIATEIIYSDAKNTIPSYFRPVDVGTIYRGTKRTEASETVRQSSFKRLEELTGVKLSQDNAKMDEYAWAQVVDDTPRQVFTPEELNVFNFYPSTDIEHSGYPVSPLDTCVNAITTYLSIETYNRLYFQNGRAAKGMLVIKSDTIEQNDLEAIKQGYEAGVNNVQNSFRTPVFGIGEKDNVTWVSTGNDSKGEGEFFYLTDQVSRNILAAFGMAPEEVPGFGHLGRGSNQSSLNDSSNQFKLEAARDVGLRPLILKFEDFINKVILQIFDPELAQICQIKLSGLDASTREQESARIGNEMGLYYDYDTVLTEVEKDTVGEHLGGKVPFNSSYRQVLDTYNQVGEIIGNFYNQPGAFVDPSYKYIRDPFYFQYLQLLQTANPAAFNAIFVSKKTDIELFKMLVKDYLDELEE